MATGSEETRGLLDSSRPMQARRSSDHATGRTQAQGSEPVAALYCYINCARSHLKFRWDITESPQYLSKLTYWLSAGTAGLCHKLTSGEDILPAKRSVVALIDATQ
jgi:hypothetical protein